MQTCTKESGFLFGALMNFGLFLSKIIPENHVEKAGKPKQTQNNKSKTTESPTQTQKGGM